MKKLLLLTLAALLVVPCLADGRKIKKANAETDAFRYDIEYANPAGDGMVQVKVWSYSKKSRVAAEQNRKNAVHGIIFKGYSPSDGTSVSQRPLMKEADGKGEHAAFFEEFFSDGGNYRQYVSQITDGSNEVRKVGKQYKVGAVVTVNKDLLRKHLEAAGVLRSLSSGF